MRIILVAAVWSNTKGNHAGMHYLAERIRKDSGLPVSVIATPTYALRYISPAYTVINYLVGLYLALTLKRGDVVVLMEYLLPKYDQSVIARSLKGKVKIVGIAHLVPKRLESFYSAEALQLKVGYLDQLWVLGSSLKTYFVSKQIPEPKIHVTYHYVDTTYYHPIQIEENVPQEFKVICMGSMERNYSKLAEIISLCPDIHFVVCIGNSKVSQVFQKIRNVTVVGYIEENELLSLMQSSEVSLNVMNDTIGSNVITTSLAVGHIIVASKVGSIEDYITDGIDGLLFENVAGAAECLERLKEDRALRRRIRACALGKAQDMRIENFINWFATQLTK
jgi:glycosyltransferase involved in cell wall biosynthesis